MVNVLDETGTGVACFQTNYRIAPPLCMALDMTTSSPAWSEEQLNDSRFFGHLVSLRIGGKLIAWLSGGSPYSSQSRNQ